MDADWRPFVFFESVARLPNVSFEELTNYGIGKLRMACEHVLR